MGNQNAQPYTFDKVVRLTISFFAIVIGLYFLYELRGVLLPFFIAWLIAYMLNPVVRFLKKRLRLTQGIAVVTTLLLCLGLVVLVGYLLVPLLQEEIWQINTLISNYDFGTFTHNGVPVNVADVINRFIDFKEIRAALSRENVIETIEHLSPAVRMLFSNTISFILGFTVVFLIGLYLLFILLDYDKINELWRFLIPPKYRKRVFSIAGDVEYNMNKYFRHQALICVILAVLYAIGFQLIGLPVAILFGIIVGLVHMIPYLQVITFPPAVLLCWLGSTQSDISFWAMIGLTVLVYVLVQLVMDLFLVPRIMGKAMGLNPAIILLSLSIWGTLFGIVGMIIAIPLTTIILSYYKEFIAAAELEVAATLKEEESKSSNETD